jgi:hypothetical protein
MPQQLIYTSAPRGIVAGRSGYCTVARSALMREALMLQLEKFCYYQHLSLAGGRERPIFAYRIVDIRGTRFHVLSRIQDAGLDFTGRTNFIAHHLVFTPEEIRQFPAPPVILGHWPGWLASWTKEPQLLGNETWTDLVALNDQAVIPAQTWRQVTGDAANGYGLLEARAGASFRVDDQTDITVLDLFAESLALLEVRDARRDYRIGSWSYTLTTSMQEQDNPADFRWRCLHADNPAANRFVTPDCRALSAVRTIKCTNEEAAFARNGRLPPTFTVEPQDLQIAEGETARFTAKAEGVPSPAYQWFLEDRNAKRQPLAGEISPELVVARPPLGISRYVVRASNSTGDVASRVAKLSVDERAKVALSGMGGARTTKTAIHQKSEEDIERQRQKIAQQENSRNRPGTGLWVAGLIVVAVVLIGILCVHVGMKHRSVVAVSPAPVTGVASQAPAPADVSPQTTNTPLALPAKPPGDTISASAPLLLSHEPGPLTSPWKAESIGWSSTARAPRYDQGKFSFSAPTGKFWPQTTNDGFFFASRPSSGPVDFVARIPKVEKIGKSIWGIMLRASESADAPFVFIGSSQNSVVWMTRSASGNPSTYATYAHLRTNEPLYLRLNYQADNFSGNFSNDGKNWSPLCAVAQIDLNGANYLLGFAVCSESEDAPASPVFDDVAINGVKQ